MFPTYTLLFLETRHSSHSDYGVAGLKSLANHLLRLYHIHKVWCGGVDKGLIECGKTYE